MNLFNLIKNDIKNHESLVSLIIFIIIIFLENNTIPKNIYSVINTIYGKILLVILSIVIFLKTKSIILGISLLILSSELIRHSNSYTNTYNKYIFSNKNKNLKFDKYDKYPITLEEEVVYNMAPLVKSNVSIYSNYKPIINDIHQASLI